MNASHRTTDGTAASSARHVLDSILCLSPSDTLLVLAERSTLDAAELFVAPEVACSSDVVLVVLPEGPGGLLPVPTDVATLLKQRTAFLAVTARGFTHTAARREACEAGARGLSMPRGTIDLLASDAVRADYRLIAAAGEALVGELDGTDRFIVRTPLGTDLELDVSGGRWFAERGLCDRPGDFGNLPGGEVSIAPVDARGTLVVDGSINPLGWLDEPLTLTIEDRTVVDIRGPRADELRAFLEPFGAGAFNVAEIGIGINPGADVSGIIVKDEKALGTAHIGFGNNSNMGGFSRATKVDVPVHIDGVLVVGVSMSADGRPVRPMECFPAVSRGGG